MRKEDWICERVDIENAISFEIGPNQGIIVSRERNIHSYNIIGGKECLIPDSNEMDKWYRDNRLLNDFIPFKEPIIGNIDNITQYIQLRLNIKNAIRNFEIAATGNCWSCHRGHITDAGIFLNMISSEIKDDLLRDTLMVALGSKLLHQCSPSYHPQEILLQDGRTVYGNIYPERLMLKQLQKTPKYLHSRIINYDLRKALHTDGHDLQRGFMTMYFLEQYPELIELVDKGHRQYTFPFLDYTDKSSSTNNRMMLKMLKDGRIIK